MHYPAHAADKTKCLLKPSIPAQNLMVKTPENLIAQADNARSVENFCQAIEYLKIYQQLYGQDNNYYRILARTYSDAGYYEAATEINSKLLQHQPQNDYLLATQAYTYFLNNIPKKALEYYNQLIQAQPNSEELTALNTTIIDGLKDKGSIGQQFISLNNIDVANYIPTGPEFVYQNDSVTIYRLPFLWQKHFDEKNTLIVKYQYENYFATIDSGLATINGQTSIYDNEIYVGIKSLISEYIQIQALIADLAINAYNNFLTYDVDLDISPNDFFIISFDFYRDLFRPINIYNGTPRMVSLGVIETSERAHVAFLPDVMTSLNVDIRYGTFSDSNSYYYLIVTPYRTFFTTDKVKVSFGLDLEVEQFAKDLETSGYYSPLLYQSYQVTSLLRYKVSDKLDVELYGAIGTVKDNFTAMFGYNTCGLLGTRYRLTPNLDLSAQIVHIYQQLNPNYYEVNGYLGLNWRV